MYIIGIDPGPEKSGIVAVELSDMQLGSCYDECPNRDIEHSLHGVAAASIARGHHPEMAIEMIANYGMPSGASIFETCIQIGRMEKSCSVHHERVFRKEVAVTMCGSVRAKGPNIRQAIIDMYGGKEEAIGGNKCKKCKGKGRSGTGRPTCTQCNGTGWLNPPGPLFCVKSHAWAALAVALTYAIRRGYLSSSVVNPGGLGKNYQPSVRDCPEGNHSTSTTPQDEPF